MVLLSTKLKTRYQDLKQHPSHPPWNHLKLIPELPVRNHLHTREVSLKVTYWSSLVPVAHVPKETLIVNYFRVIGA